MNIFRCEDCKRIRTEYEIKVQHPRCKCGSLRVRGTEDTNLKVWWHLVLWNYHLNFGKLQ